MSKTDRNDIFNPEYKNKKQFLRKQNIYRILFISIIISLFIYGSRDFIFGKITYFEIRNMKFKITDSIIIPKNNTIGYFIINRNPYDVKIIMPEINGVYSNYNSSIISCNDFVYISFTSTLKLEKVINIVGVKYG